MRVNWQKLGDDFPTLYQAGRGHPLVYFDNATTSQKPHAVSNALVRFYERDNPNVERLIGVVREIQWRFRA